MLSLSQIRCDGGTQSRAAIHQATVDEYAEDYKNGANFPPITVFYDGEIFWLADGFHREKAARKAGLTEIAAIVKQGTRRDAVLYSVGANAKHGLRRTNADKRRAVMTLLEDGEWKGWSNVAIAKQCGVDEKTVRNLRKSLTSENPKLKNSEENNLTSENPKLENSEENNLTSENPKLENSERTYTTKHGTQAKMNTANIGKRKSSEPLPPSAEEKEVQSPREEENNHPDYAPVEIDNSKTDDKLKDSDFPKQSQKPKDGKPKLINPLSIGDKVKVKDNHYFGSQEGVVTQLTSPDSVVVAFDNGERDVIRLTDLDLPTSLAKPITVTNTQPVKKEVIKEGLNYKAGNGCTWYVQVTEENYQRLQEYLLKVGSCTIDGALAQFLDSEEERIKQESTPNTNDILVNLISKVAHLNQPQLTTLLNACAQADSRFPHIKANIYINRQIVNANKKASQETGTMVEQPAIAINTYFGSIYAKEVVLSRNAKLIQSATANPLYSGASIWIESQFEDLIIDGQRASLDMFK